MDSKTLALLATLVLAATMTMNNGANTTEWESFKAVHGKSYATAEEESYRLAVWMQSHADVESHNADETQTFTKGINQFSDLTNAEFRSIYLGFKPVNQVANVVDESTEMVGSVNWVTKGAVQVVKNQGQCGSCWAFSTVASTEGASFLSTGTLGDFSEEQLCDCSSSYGNNGCQGGLMDNGFKYFIAKGICTESSYPYTAGGGQTGSCQASSCSKSSFTISSYQDCAGVSTLQSALNSRPVSVAVDASAWSSYSGGILSSCGTSLDHGVLAAGYTSSYWLIKNSWGGSWGEQGYIRLAPGNTCGLANSPSYPIA